MICISSKTKFYIKLLSVIAVFAVLSAFFCSIFIPRITVKLSTAGTTVHKVDDTVVESPQNIADAPEAMQLYAENKRLQLFANQETGDFLVRDKETGEDWLSNPPPDTVVNDRISGMSKFRLFSQLIIYTIALDETGTNVTQEGMLVSRTGSVIQGGLNVEAIKNGVKLSYYFPSVEVTLPVLVTLNDDGFSASVDTAQIKEDNVHRLLWYSLLPYFGAGGPEDDGYMLVPDGSGALIRYNTTKSNYAPYHEPVYGYDPTHFGETRPPSVEGIRLPVFGMKKNDSAYIAVITQGDAAAYIDAQTANMYNEWNNIYATFQVLGTADVIIGQSTDGSARRIVKHDVRNHICDYGQVKYILLGKGKSEYSDMAQAYKDYLLRDGVTEKFKDSSSTPLFINVFGGIIKKESQLGFLVDKYKVLTTYEQAGEIAADLKNKGVQDISMSYTNWSKDSAKRLFQDKVHFESRLGGKTGLIALNKKLQALNIKLFLEYNPYNAAKNGNGYIGFLDAAKKISGQSVQVYDYDLATLMINKNVPPAVLPNPRMTVSNTEKFMADFAKKTDAGVYYPNFAQILYSNHSSSNFAARTVVKELVESSLQKNKGAALADFPNVYSFPYISYATNLPSNSSGFNIFDEDVPFYQMVASGIIQYSTPVVNIGRDLEDMTLFAIETGSGLYFQFTYNNPEVLMETRYDSRYGADYALWSDDAVKANQVVQNAFKEIGSNVIVRHNILADGVGISTFANGCRVVVNRSSKDFVFEGRLISPMSFVVLGKEVD